MSSDTENGGVGEYPRSVTPGIENQSEKPGLPPDGVFCHLDWIRLTISDDRRDKVTELLFDLFGEWDRMTNGPKWFTAGWLWEPGVELSTGHRRGICEVDIRGERLSMMDADEAVQLLDRLCMLGMKPTRIDCAIDYVGQGVDLYPNAVAACQAHELCRLRYFEPAEGQRTHGPIEKRLLRLGKRDSPICARIYDKGLELRLAPPGFWERLEVEFKADRAFQAAKALVEAGPDWPVTLRNLVAGAIDFRAVNGRSELARRPQAPWWAQLMQGVTPVRLPPMPADSSMGTWLEGLRTSYGRRLLQMAELAETPLGELAESLLDGLTPAEGMTPAMRQFLAAIRGDRAAGGTPAGCSRKAPHPT